MQDRILSKSRELFTIYGFRSISMGRLAKEIGCSTKTLYKFYPNKTIIIKKMVEIGIERDIKILKDIDKKNILAIDKLLEIESTFFVRHNRNLYPGFLDDLRKYHPDIFGLINKYLDNNSEPWIRKKLFKGISEGYFKENLKINILSRYLIEFSLITLSAKNFPSSKYQPGKVFETMIENFLYGISTIKGQEYLDSNIKKYFPDEE